MSALLRGTRNPIANAREWRFLQAGLTVRLRYISHSAKFDNVLQGTREEREVGLRFRKSFKIAPGIRWNVGLRGSSVSIGRRGATMNFGKRGARATVGIPGTGLSYSERIGAGARRSVAMTSPASSGPAVDPNTLGIAKTPWKLMVGVLSIVLLFVFPWAGVLGLIFTIAIPSRTKLAKRELHRRLSQFQSAVSGLQTSSRLDDIDRVLALPEQLSIPEAHLGDAVDQLRAVRTLTVLEQLGRPDPVEGATDALGSEPCYFRNSVFLDKRGKDETGTVYFGNERVVFVGETRIEVPWEKVLTVKRESRTVVVQRSDRQTPYNFVFDEIVTAAKAEWVASKMVTAGAV